MNYPSPATILIIEDDLDIADMLNAYFRVQGYQVLTANWGDDGLKASQENNPDLIILDIRLPDMDGFEVARRLKANRKTSEIPIIFLTEKRQREDRLQGLSLAAEDYITKPFDIQELRLRVRNVLLRHKRESLTNPVTGLPQKQLLIEELEKRLADSTFGMVLIALRNLDPFREVYGFIAADDLMRAVVMMLQDSLEKHSGKAGFLGQLSAQDFLMILPAVDLEKLAHSSQQRLEKSFDYFYNERDRETGRFDHRLTVTVFDWKVDPEKQNLQKILIDLDQIIRQV